MKSKEHRYQIILQRHGSKFSIRVFCILVTLFENTTTTAWDHDTSLSSNISLVSINERDNTLSFATLSTKEIYKKAQNAKTEQTK